MPHITTAEHSQRLETIMQLVRTGRVSTLQEAVAHLGTTHQNISRFLRDACNNGFLNRFGIPSTHLCEGGVIHALVEIHAPAKDPRAQLLTPRNQTFLRACAQKGSIATIARKTRMPVPSARRLVYSLAQEINLCGQAERKNAHYNSQRFLLGCVAVIHGLADGLHGDAYPQIKRLDATLTRRLVVHACRQPHALVKHIAQRCRVNRAFASHCISKLSGSLGLDDAASSNGFKWPQLCQFIGSHRPRGMNICVYADEVYRYASTREVLQAHLPRLREIATQSASPRAASDFLCRLQSSPFRALRFGVPLPSRKHAAMRMAG